MTATLLACTVPMHLIGLLCFRKPRPRLQLVKVEGGIVEGTVEDGIAIYRGIPFAAPPVGRPALATTSTDSKNGRAC